MSERDRKGQEGEREPGHEGASCESSETLRNGYLGEATQRANWQKEQQSLRRIAAVCAENAVPFYLVLFPVLFELDFYPFDAEILRFGREAFIPAMSLTDGFRGKVADSLWVAPGGQHRGETGHRTAALTLCRDLRDVLQRLR